MTDTRSKRKWAGAPIKDLRKRVPEPERIPPHKKPKVWTLTVEWTDTTVWRRHRQFTSRAARDEARVRIERHFREEAEKQHKKQPRRYVAFWGRNSPFADFTDEKVTSLKTPPAYIETYEDKPEKP